MSQPTKTQKEGAYKAKELKIKPTETRSVIPYDLIVKALKAGEVYVLDVSVKSKHTLAQARGKLKKDTGLNVKLGTIEGTEQFAFFV